MLVPIAPWPRFYEFVLFNVFSVDGKEKIITQFIQKVKHFHVVLWHVKTNLKVTQKTNKQSYIVYQYLKHPVKNIQIGECRKLMTCMITPFIDSIQYTLRFLNFFPPLLLLLKLAFFSPKSSSNGKALISS